MRRAVLAPVVLAPVVLAAILLSACGSSSPSGTAATTSSTSNTLVPTVADPTDLTVEPVISAGTANPPTRLLTRNLVVGTGATAGASSTVSVKYVGADYANGKDFTSSTWTDGKAASFSLHKVVPGFAEGIAGMKVGGRREIVIPPALGYGATGSPPAVQPNETLVFVVDLKAVT